jgi:hypothetical protein
MSDTSQRRYETAGEVLDSIREQLKEESLDDMTLLLKIFKDLKTLDTNKLSPREASRWMIQKETKQEKRIIELATQVGFNSGFAAGLFGGFILCVFIWGLFISARS